MKFNNHLSVMRPHSMRLSSHYGLLFFVMKYQYKARKVNGKRIDEHRLVAIQHWGEEACKGMDVHHKNGDKLDNRIENLELIPRSRHSQKHMLGRTLPEETRKKLSIATLNYFKTHTMNNKKMVGQFSLSGVLLAVYESCSAVSYYGFDRPHVKDCCKGIRKKEKGFIWKYVDKVPPSIELKTRINAISNAGVGKLV